MSTAAPTCTATVQSLPNTGADVSMWWIAAAVVLILASTALLLRTRRRGRVVAALLAIGLLAGVSTLPGPAPASASDVVEYADGCALIDVDPGSVTWTAPPRAADLLPGDTAPVLSLTVTNSYAEPVRLYGRLRTATPFASDLEGRVRFDGAEGPVRLSPGEQIDVTLGIALARTADDDLQDAETPIGLVLTATAR